MAVETANILLRQNLLQLANIAQQINSALSPTQVIPPGPPPVSSLIITTFAGNYALRGGFSGDGGVATSAALNGPGGIAADAAGNVYFCDILNCCVRVVNTQLTTQILFGVSVPAGDIATVAGVGTITQAYSGDGGPATSAHMARPCYLAFDAAGNLYIADQNAEAIRRVDVTTNIMTTALGGCAGYNVPSATQNNGPAFFNLTSVANASSGNTVYTGIFAVTPNSKVYIQGFGTAANNGWFTVGSSTPTTVTVNNPSGVAETHAAKVMNCGFNVPQALFIDAGGNIYVADTNANSVKVYNAQGTTTTFFGTSVLAGYLQVIAGSASGVNGYAGDGGPATSAYMWWPLSCTIDSYGSMYICDFFNNVVRQIVPNGTIYTWAGTRSSVSISSVVASGGNNTYTYTLVSGSAPTVTSAITVAGCTSSTNNCTRLIGSVGAGTFTVSQAGGVTEAESGATGVYGTLGYTGDGGSATSATFNQPFDIEFDTQGNAYVVDCANAVIRKITPAGIISTFAGNGTPGYSGDGGLPSNAQLNQPISASLDTSNDLFIGEWVNGTIREVKSVAAVPPAPFGAPTVLSVSPSTGTTTGGTLVTITGTNFHPSATVKFGSSSATSVVVNSWSSIMCTTPAGSVGAASVTVTNTDSQSGTLASAFTYVFVPALVSSGVSGAATSPVTLNTTGATLLVAVLASESATPTVSDSVGGQTNAWNYTTVVSSTNNKTVLAYAYAATGGGALHTGPSHVITPAGTTPSCAVYTFSGTTSTSGVLNANNQVGQQAGTGVASYTLQAGSITPTAGSLVVMGFSNNGTVYSASTIPTGFTGEQKQTSGATLELVGGCYKLNDSGSAENPSWTVTLNAFTGVVIAAFK